MLCCIDAIEPLNHNFCVQFDREIIYFSEQNVRCNFYFVLKSLNSTYGKI